MYNTQLVQQYYSTKSKIKKGRKAIARLWNQQIKNLYKYMLLKLSSCTKDTRLLRTYRLEVGWLLTHWAQDDITLITPKEYTKTHGINQSHWAKSPCNERSFACCILSYQTKASSFRMCRGFPHWHTDFLLLLDISVSVSYVLSISVSFKVGVTSSSFSSLNNGSVLDSSWKMYISVISSG